MPDMSLPQLKVSHCRWLSVPGRGDVRGKINFLEFDQELGFTVRRLFWLHDIAADQWRGRHGHRESHLVTLVMNGSCQLHLDDGKVKETVVLDDPGRALHIGPMVWHELDNFAPQTVILARSEDPPASFVTVPEELLSHLATVTGEPPDALMRGEIVYFDTPSGGAVFAVGSITFCGSLWHPERGDFTGPVSQLLENVVRRFQEET